MTQKLRLTGIDLFRVFAIYGVILLHSDEGMTNYPVGWKEILQFSSFAVPFFLATSFYLTFNKVYKAGGQYFLKERLARLLVPYFVWTGLYIVYKVLKYLLQNEMNNVTQLFRDPVGLILFGGAAFQLYFLPLLVAGTIIIKPLTFLIKNRAKNKFLIVLFVASLILYEVLIYSGNSFQIATGSAFEGLLNAPAFSNLQYNNPVSRIILTEIALIIRCLPYIFMAMILSKVELENLLHKNGKIIVTILWVLSFLIINTFAGYFLPLSIYELTQGFTALMAGISLSNHLKANKIISSLSFCSFGIYLVHLLFVEIFQTVEARFYSGGMFRLSTPNLLIFSLLILALSWMATDIIMKKKSIAKILFGV
ncbi:MAG TPA: acyltransferase [Leptolyngbyaceae cyanobacterium]